MSRLTRDGAAEPVSRDQIRRRDWGQGNIHFPCLADHEQAWQPCPVDLYSAESVDHTYIHTYILIYIYIYILIVYAVDNPLRGVLDRTEMIRKTSTEHNQTKNKPKTV